MLRNRACATVVAAVLEYGYRGGIGSRKLSRCPTPNVLLIVASLIDQLWHKNMQNLPLIGIYSQHLTACNCECQGKKRIERTSQNSSVIREMEITHPASRSCCRPAIKGGDVAMSTVYHQSFSKLKS